MPRLWHHLWEVPDDYRIVTALFLKGLALIYAIAFGSLAVQIVGLAGSEGMFPIAEQLVNAENALGAARYRLVPSVFWLDHSDTALLAAAWGGVALSIPLLFGLWPRSCLIVQFALYLSLQQAGTIFLHFQWNYLILEAGFLAIFLAHGGSRLVIWMMRWLLFRLRFLSGISKIISGDPSWIGLTALSSYFETQPLPHIGAWYAHHLPPWLLQAGTLATLIIEIAVPFLFIAPRRWRMVGAALTILMQVLIIATSNHNFINLLTILLCLFLFDDSALRRLIPSWTAPLGRAIAGKGHRLIFGPLAALILLVSGLQAASMITGWRAQGLLGSLVEQANALRLGSVYHVFPTMNRERLEVVIEWSGDGTTWQPLAFNYRPGDPAHPPGFVMPHQPRLDWLIWFLPPQSPVFMVAYWRFLEALLDGSPAVLNLLPEGTFAEGPPRYLRASLWHYRFTTAEERARTGDWWVMEWRAPFPPWPYLEHPAI
ncbi:lipase maturation factor family protein [Magnetospira thiophila]